jgi:hypothetical protein
LQCYHTQVNAWSFERIRKGSDRGAYFHDYFLRNDPDVSFKMVHPRMLRHLLAPVVQLSNNNRYLYPRPVPPGIAMLRRGEANNNVCIYPAMNMQHRAGALVPAVCSSENIAADGPIAYHENVAGGGDIPPVRSENIDAGGGDIPPVRSENFDAGGIPPVRSENIDAGDIPPVRSSDIAADGIPPVRSENTAAGGGIPPVRSETIAAGGIPPVRNENIAAGGGIPPVRSENNVAGGIPPVRSENIAAGGIAPVRSETVISGDIPFARNKQAAAGGLNVTVTTAPYTALEESRLQVSSSDSDSIVKVVSARKRPVSNLVLAFCLLVLIHVHKGLPFWEINSPLLYLFLQKTTTRSEDRLHALADLCFQAEQNDNVLQRKV